MIETAEGAEQMARQSDHIRKKLSKRKRIQNRGGTRRPSSVQAGGSPFYQDSAPEKREGFHPLWSREVFLMKLLISAALLIGCAIIFKSGSPAFEETKSYIKKAMEEEFYFAAAADWYENKFGKPLALLPQKQDGVQEGSIAGKIALPVTGKVVSDFSSEQPGIIIETEKGAAVEAMSGGLVTFSGKKEGTGNTVIIQHKDKTESWYGHLEELSVRTYEHIPAGKKLGTVRLDDKGKSGTYYFAIKQGKKFIDPGRVIQFE